MCLRFFKKRKEKKKLKEVTDRYEADILSSERLKDIDFVKRYVVEQCEQMTKSATELSDLKKEYAILRIYSLSRRWTRKIITSFLILPTISLILIKPRRI